MELELGLGLVLWQVIPHQLLMVLPTAPASKASTDTSALWFCKQAISRNALGPAPTTATCGIRPSRVRTDTAAAAAGSASVVLRPRLWEEEKVGSPAIMVTMVSMESQNAAATGRSDGGGSTRDKRTEATVVWGAGPLTVRQSRGDHPWALLAVLFGCVRQQLLQLLKM